MTERRQRVISNKKEHQYSRPGVEVGVVGVVGVKSDLISSGPVALHLHSTRFD